MRRLGRGVGSGTRVPAAHWSDLSSLRPVWLRKHTIVLRHPIAILIRRLPGLSGSTVGNIQALVQFA